MLALNSNTSHLLNVSFLLEKPGIFKIGSTKVCHSQTTVSGQGLSLVKALVSSVVLMTVASQSISLMTDSMRAFRKARLRGELYAAVHIDLEEVRHELASWKAAQSIEGQLIYELDSNSCSSNKLGSDFIYDKQSNDELLNKTSTPKISPFLNELFQSKEQYLHPQTPRVIQDTKISSS